MLCCLVICIIHIIGHHHARHLLHSVPGHLDFISLYKDLNGDFQTAEVLLTVCVSLGYKSFPGAQLDVHSYITPLFNGPRWNSRHEMKNDPPPLADLSSHQASSTVLRISNWFMHWENSWVCSVAWVRSTSPTG